MTTEMPKDMSYLINVAWAARFAVLFNLKLVELTTEFGHILYWRSK